MDAMGEDTFDNQLTFCGACHRAEPAFGNVSQAYDQHLNMILGEVEETVTSSEIDDETYEEIIKVPLASLPLPRPASSPTA